MPAWLEGVVGELRASFRELREVFRGNIASIAISWFLFNLTGSLINPFFAKYAKDLGAGDYEVALMRSLGLLALALSLVPGGVLTDLLGRVKVILVGTGLVTISQFLYALAPDWRWLTIVYIFDNAAHFYVPALTAIVMDSLRRGKEFKGFLALNIVTSIPGLFMPIVGGYLYQTIGSLGIRYGFMLQGFVALSVLILRIKTLRETFKPVDKDLGRIILELAGYRGVLTKALKLYLFTSILWQITHGLPNTYMAIYIIDCLRVSPTTWGALSSIATLGVISSSILLAGRDVDVERWAVRCALVISSTLLVYAALPSIRGSYLVLVILLSTSLSSSIASNILNSSLSTLQTRMLPPEIRGRAVGIQRVLDNLGAAAGALVAGVLYTSLSFELSFTFSGVMGLVSTAYLYTITSPRSPRARLERRGPGE